MLLLLLQIIITSATLMLAFSPSGVAWALTRVLVLPTTVAGLVTRLVALSSVCNRTWVTSTGAIRETIFLLFALRPLDLSPYFLIHGREEIAQIGLSS
ncbi:hypothetical protein A9G41_02055 [Gilliamella sp. Nev5-1]|nr:hypothetical protein A9G41_02055 [Gilliamella apicola]